MNNLLTSLQQYKIVPVVVLKKTEDCRPLLKGLCDGGLPVAEITFRTECASECIGIASREFKNMIIGAGTVINAEQAKRAIDSGAQFIVGPGFCAEVAEYCKGKAVYIPGCVTPTEIITAINYGIEIIKFFPANIYGGTKTLKAFSSVFSSVRFIPTGGVNKDNLKEYLELKNVFAVGGSWMASGTPEEIAKASAEAVAIRDSING